MKLGTTLLALWSTCVLAVGCGGTSSSETTAPAPTTGEAGSGSADPATPPATEPPLGKASKCEQDGGVCQSKVAMTACKRFEEAAEWGCTTPDTGCCLNN